MMYYPDLLLIGGSSRNVGKTTLILHYIQKFKDIFPIIGLKVTSIYPNDETLHGYHKNSLAKNYEIFKEDTYDGIKDTSKMLLAGAKDVYYIRTLDQFISEAFLKFSENISTETKIICESVSLRKYIQPGLFILIQHSKPHQMKSSYTELKPLADLIITSNGNNFDFDTDHIGYFNERWRILMT